MEASFFNIGFLLKLAGLAQITLVVGSLAIPRVLGWKLELQKVQPLIKQMFWTYAAYILVINLCIGLLSFFVANEMADGSKMSLLVSGFIALYWISRVLVQFFYFDRENFPVGPWHVFAEVLLVALFVSLSLLYSCLFYINY